MAYKASVCIPCYNKEASIARALDSLIAQSRFEDFEIIVVDDASKDASVAITQSYADRYENIKLIRCGVGSGSPARPRNIALDASDAEYVIFMDPDDMVVNDGYSLLLTKMEKYQSDLIIGVREMMTEDGYLEYLDYIDKKFTFIKSDVFKT